VLTYVIYFLKKVKISPTIMTRTRIFDSPETAKMPKTESIQRTSMIDAINLSGLGNIPIAHPITSSISNSHRVT
jgi:hypothetical protein